jgi:RNA polymerase sigma factor (sigma-70 family)
MSTPTHRVPRRTRPPHLRLLPGGLPPLPAAVPILRPGEDVTPAQDALLTGLAHRARRGDVAARDLLWLALAPKLEPSSRRCERLAWRMGWARRDGRPWEMEDLRQEAWLVFVALIDAWPGEGSFVPYAVAHFPWRLKNAMRRLGPPRGRVVLVSRPAEAAAECAELGQVEAEELRTTLLAALSPADAAVLRLRVELGASWGDVACQLGVSRRTVARRWARIRRVTRELLREQPPDEDAKRGNPERQSHHY